MHPVIGASPGVRGADDGGELRTCFLCLALLVALPAHAGERWVSANDAEVRRSGAWTWTAHRYAAEPALITTEDGAALEFGFSGQALVLCLDTLTPPNYGAPELGRLEVFVDGAAAALVYPRMEAGEVVILRSDGQRTRRVRVVHRRDGPGAGCRVRGFRIVHESAGELALVISGEQNGGLVDVRAVLTQNGRVVRDALMRNWLTGQCRLAGIPPGEGYALELRAAGWKTARIEGVSIVNGRETELAPVYLERERDVHVDVFKFPAFGRPFVRLPGQSFRARFQAHQAAIHGARVARHAGPAVIARACTFVEDKAAAYYYHREGSVTLPADTPSGVYDLEITISDARGERTLVSPRSVTVANRVSADPMFLSFGHLDTWGQHQAEYLARIVAIANVVAPDMVLFSNAANPAYEAGALYGLEVPFVVNFGNHRNPEPAAWFGEPVGIVDFGAEFCVLNFGRAWDTDLSDADALLAARKDVRIKIINAFEPNAPVATFLDRHSIALIHDAHGPGPTVMKMGGTPTIRVGKANSESFRLIRFRDGRPVSYTYRGHATAPIPFPRSAPPPVRLIWDAANDGVHRAVTARFENDLEEALPQARIVFVMPRGSYATEDGTIESEAGSEDGQFTVVSVRRDIGAKSAGRIAVRPRAP